MNKEQWIADIINSAEDVRPVASNPFLATRIESKLDKGLDKNVIPLKRVYAFALAMAVLVIVNITAWQYAQPGRSKSGIQQLMQDYGWSNNDLYSLNSPK